MRKTSLALIVSVIVLCFFAVGCVKKPISEEKAIAIAQTVVSSDSVIDYSAPTAEMLRIEDERAVLGVDDKWTEVKGKTVWAVSWTTEMDALLGPITVYIDAYSGRIYGFNARL